MKAQMKYCSIIMLLSLTFITSSSNLRFLEDPIHCIPRECPPPVTCTPIVCPPLPPCPEGQDCPPPAPCTPIPCPDPIPCDPIICPTPVEPQVYDAYTKLYFDEKFEGEAIKINLSMNKYELDYQGTISFKVIGGTFRIIDWLNKEVYRFERGTEVKNLKISHSKWAVTMGKPRCDNDCVMVFKNSNYSGKFELLHLNLEVADGLLNGAHLEEKFSSFTTPYSGLVSYVALIKHKDEYQTFTTRSAFSDEMEYIYIFGEINPAKIYAVAVRTLHYKEADALHPATLPANDYLIVMGDNTIGKLVVENNKVDIPLEKTFVYLSISEHGTLLVRDLSDIPENKCVRVYDDEDGFVNPQDVCNSAEKRSEFPFKNSKAKYILFPHAGVRAVFINYANGATFNIKYSGKIPKYNANVKDFLVVPNLADETKAMLFMATETFNVPETSAITNGELLHGSVSFINGYKSGVTPYFVNSDLKQVVKVKPGEYQFGDIGDAQVWFTEADVFDAIIPQECVKLYKTCDDIDQYFVPSVCLGDDYDKINLHDARYVVFPKNSKISNVLFYRADDKLAQLEVSETTCLPHDLEHDHRITLIPKVQAGEVLVYSKTFYRGEHIVLKAEDDAKTLDKSVEDISLVIAEDTIAKVESITNNKIFGVNKTNPNICVKHETVAIASGKVKNNQASTLWTFDDEHFNDFRILYGGHFFSEEAVSSQTEYLAFPREGIAKALLIDRDNSVVESYDYSAELVKVDRLNIKRIDRAIILNEDFDSVLLAKGKYFENYVKTLGNSSVYKLKKHRHYSLVSSFNQRLRIFNWSLLNHLHNDISLGVAEYTAAQYIKPNFTVDNYGHYSFVVGDNYVKNLNEDCVFVFDAVKADCKQQTNMRRFCFSQVAADSAKLTSTANPEGSFLIVPTASHMKLRRRYKGFNFEGNFNKDTVCIPVAANREYSFNIVAKDD